VLCGPSNCRRVVSRYNQTVVPTGLPLVEPQRGDGLVKHNLVEDQNPVGVTVWFLTREKFSIKKLKKISIIIFHLKLL
jgi:hypothetical protein